MNNSEENTNEIIDDIEIVDVSEDTDTATNEAAKEDEAASSIENDTNNNYCQCQDDISNLIALRKMKFTVVRL